MHQKGRGVSFVMWMSELSWDFGMSKRCPDTAPRRNRDGSSLDLTGVERGIDTASRSACSPRRHVTARGEAEHAILGGSMCHSAA
jgi:hypothetical protein